jgi:NAD(P)H dehydrogenase (quinone)
MSVGLKQISDIRMLDGFNEGWIEFANGEAGAQKVGTSLESVLKSLIQ